MSSNESKGSIKLSRRSQKGDFAASFQLAMLYNEGISVEKSPEKYQHYKQVCAGQLINNKFKIDSLKLENFKGFNNIEIEFSKKNNTTILIGNNGCGKSTILEAIQKTLTHLSARLATNSPNGELIDELEITEKSKFSKIIPTFSLQDCEFSMELASSRVLEETQLKGKYSEINELSKVLRLANSERPDLSLPLFASYTVGRANDVTTKDIEDSEEIKDNHIWNKAKAYNKSLSGKADFKLFFRWFKEMVEKDNSENSEFIVLKSKIKSKEEEINSPLLKKLLTKHPETKELIKQYQSEVNALKKQLNATSNIDNKSLEVVKNAIYMFLDGFSNLKLMRSPLDLTIVKNEVTLSVLQLSQGEKSVLSLVADIARRLTLLNPNSTESLNGSGIVLIDEIDLHLHPSWQQKIIQRLEHTFPNLQFIITTHSPQVCHTIDSDNIWLLRNGKKYRPPKGTRGAVSSWVLENLFFVDERPPNDKYTEMLNEYKELVYQEKYKEERSISLGKTLTAHFGEDDEALIKIKLYIDNRVWDKEYEEG
ncbi:retron Ec78 anti-phage system effector ATPase PtuA [Colwellia polaris]|jgi:predicted ATP-binding protein involved in virulence|uniref:retron Ec78 anti-phage system effector ATPase PtuA n=1 Tax=Colwellia polaris TaxID=326537 RepID=UPI000A175A29|nr:retron Ec78 anti-phage system effector ATPase PtuA [Colwellia polaris]|tara:strand:- start:3817 stop:5430 length:1614 start_codon:yes stop_codon:yes gene_type:complete